MDRGEMLFYLLLLAAAVAFSVLVGVGFGEALRADQLPATVPESPQDDGLTPVAYLPIAQRSCVILYADDFSNPASGWPVSDSASIRREYLNGEYHILRKTTGAGGGAISLAPFTAVDYRVQVDARGNSLAGWYGLVFGYDWASSANRGYYSYKICCGDRYSIERINPEERVELDGGTSPYIKPLDQGNALQVLRNGYQISVWANGHLLQTISDSAFTGSRNLGVVLGPASASGEAWFDNFVVCAP